jgi:hypothetical protein
VRSLRLGRRRPRPRGATRTCKASGPTSFRRLTTRGKIRQQRSSSPTRNALNWTDSARRFFVEINAWRLAASVDVARRVQRGVPVDQAHGQANIAGRRSARWRIPPLTPEAKQRADADVSSGSRSCKRRQPARITTPRAPAGSTDPRRRRERRLPSFYNTGRLNRSDGPEDRSMMERCMAAVLPDFAATVGSCSLAGAVSIFYDTARGKDGSGLSR